MEILLWILVVLIALLVIIIIAVTFDKEAMLVTFICIALPLCLYSLFKL